VSRADRIATLGRTWEAKNGRSATLEARFGQTTKTELSSMPSARWARNGRRTPEGHKLVLSVKAGLKAHGWDRRKAVQRSIAELRETDPAYKTDTEAALRSAYYQTAPLPRPLITEEEKRWAFYLIQWGKGTKRRPRSISAKLARKIVDRLLEIASHRRADLDQLFIHVESSIHRSGREKIKWLLSVVDRLATNPHYWPIPFSRRGRPDVTAGRIETYLANAPEKRAHKREIVAALKIPRTTAQTTLGSLERSRRIVRVTPGVYGLPVGGVAYAPYTPADKAILDALAGGQRTCAELRAKTGKSGGAVHAALHRLRNAGSIVLTKRGKYALAGSASPHVYARHAIIDVLRSGEKTMPELIAATGKNYGEVWQALKRMEAKGGVIQVPPSRAHPSRTWHLP
jgi:hypothetical protein